MRDDYEEQGIQMAMKIKREIWIVWDRGLHPSFIRRRPPQYENIERVVEQVRQEESRAR